MRTPRGLANARFNGEIRPFGSGSIASVAPAHTLHGEPGYRQGEALIKRLARRLAQRVPEYR